MKSVLPPGEIQSPDHEEARAPTVFIDWPSIAGRVQCQRQVGNVGTEAHTSGDATKKH